VEINNVAVHQVVSEGDEPNLVIDRYKRLVFTGSSSKLNTRSEAMKFANDKGGCILQSLPEAAAFRIAAEGNYNADRYQFTRSAALYLHKNGKVYVGFDHDIEKSMLLTYPQEGYDLQRKELILSLQEDSVKEACDRVKLVEPSKLSLELRLDGQFSSNEYVQELLGEVAPAYESFLNGICSSGNGYVWLLDREYIKGVLPNDHVLIRPCALGGLSHGLLAHVDGSIHGYARGVMQLTHDWI